MEWIILLPPVLAIVLALWTRQIYLSLFVGLWFGTTILAGYNPVTGLRELSDQIVRVFTSESNASIIIFCMLVGSLIALVQASGGVRGFVNWARTRGWGNSRTSAELMAWTVGMLIFVESSITSLTVGAVSRPIFDKLQLPREKIAYYCDATSAPVCMMIPLNGWGAYVLGLLAAQGITTGAVGLLAHSLLFNFFCILAIGFAFLLAVTGWGFGPMRRAEERAATSGQVNRPGAQPMISEDVASIKPVEGSPLHARDLLIPLGAMVAMIFVGLYITGEGNLMEGSGSTSVLWAVGIGIAVAILQYWLPRPLHGGRSILNPIEGTELVLQGARGLVGVTVLIVFAFALGQVSSDLEMGPYLAGLIGEGDGAWWLPAAVFLTGCFISFTLGSSWTCFAVLLPVALPVADALGFSLPMILGAVLSGGVYGDHASPLSDTSIISSMSAACDHVDHINTQLPYTALLAVIATVGYLLAGIIVT